MHLNNSRGVIFPWILGLALILFTLLFTSISQYKNQILGTNVYISHIKEQHLLNVAQEQFIRESSSITNLGVTTPFYISTPDGEAKATCIREESETIKCHWSLTLRGKRTKSLDTYFSF
jgi:hypothetical protein